MRDGPRRTRAIPEGWQKCNDACIGYGGFTDAKGKYHPEYTVYHVGTRPNWRWEACRGTELLAMNLESMDAAITVCREDWKARSKA